MVAPARTQDRDEEPSFSIVICTDGRATALRTTLDSLGFLDYSNFEVCVVHGPTPDGTPELLAEYEGCIKVASNPTRNLSISRNIGIALSAGEIVAFLDDDAIPEPEWLSDLAACYRTPNVGGAGGFVYNHIGTDFQYRYVTSDRLGRQKTDWDQPVTDFCFPFTSQFPQLQGTNSSFLRDALLAIGGFDEEYDYYLDETDVIVRLVDVGWVMKLIDGAYVHHKFLPSSLRTVHWENRVLHNWLPIIKNKLYFSLRHGSKEYSMNTVIDDARHFIDELASGLEWAIEHGILSGEDRERFWNEVDQAWLEGLRRGLSGVPRLINEATLRQWSRPFVPFQFVYPSSGKRTFCFVSQDYPPGRIGGVGRYTHELARSIAALGHHVHVLTKGKDHDRLDFEDGVWVHRLLDLPHTAPPPDGLAIPDHIWTHAQSTARALSIIAEKWRITAVCAPIWDCEGIATLTEGRFPLITTLQTTLGSWLVNNPALAKEPAFMRDFAEPMLALEKQLMLRSDGIMSISHAITDEIEETYAIQFDPRRVNHIPLGLEDWTQQSNESPSPLPDDSIRLLFVGRLEERKGIDILLRVVKRVLALHLNVHLDIVGNDAIPGPDGHTWRELFELDAEADAVRSRVVFHGEVTDARLRGFYRACDIFVAPSRFESFGLMLVEGMMFGKPVIGGNAGGMVEVVRNGITGLLAEPGDDASLEACLLRLIESADLRARMGAAARKHYEQHFTAQRMAADVVEMLARIGDELAEKRASVADQPVIAQPRSPTREPALAVSHVAAKKVVIVAHMIARNDAISSAVRNTYRMLSDMSGFDVAVLTCRSDFPELHAELVSCVGDVLLHPTFLEADLIIYHFGMFTELCNAMIVGNGRARQVVQFHNITPAEHAPVAHRRLIEESFRQLSNLQFADEIWSDSQVNTAVLESYGIAHAKIHEMPLVVDEPALTSMSEKRASPIELLFVGRIVPSKGVLDIVKALDTLRGGLQVPIRLGVAGNLEWSDQAYLGEIRDFVRDHELDNVVEFCGAVDNAERERLYHAAHIFVIPSYHEGFCMPVIEALRSGCIPVGYAAHNLPAITNGFGRLVSPGDIDALAVALRATIEGIAASLRNQGDTELALDRGRTSPRDFDSARLEYIQRFTFERLRDERLQRVRALLTGKELRSKVPVLA